MHFILMIALATQARVLQPQHRVHQKAPVRKLYPKVELHAVNLNETIHWRPYDDKGVPRKGANAELTRFLRCWHTGRQHRVDGRLGKVLYTVAKHYPGHRLEIFSGFRPKKYCTRAHSRHLTASAVDFRIDGVKNEALIAWLRSAFHPVGVGYYPNGVHVHLDVDRAHDTYWIDAGDAPTSSEKQEPLAAIGDTAPSTLDPVVDELTTPETPQSYDPPTEDPAID